jgi:hypothetical protein
MVTKAHQFIADLLAQRLRIDGYEVVSFDGYSETEYGLKKLPPTINRHRPDLIGLKRGCLAIGEAKTAGDITIRTHEQIEDYIDCCKNMKEIKTVVYLGVTLSIEKRVKEIVKEAQGEGCVTVLGIPDRLLPNGHN